jgi:hypothetical protein
LNVPVLPASPPVRFWGLGAGIPPGLSTFVSREKIEGGEIHRFMNMARELDVVEVLLLDQIPTGRLRDNPECGLSLADSRKLNQIREFYLSSS